jgi:hypothetical protein
MIEIEESSDRVITFFCIKGTNTLHREDGPAIIYYNGTKHWYINGKHHREDGPAVEFVNGGSSWFLDDFYFKTKEEWFEALTKDKKEKALYSEYFIRG